MCIMKACEEPTAAGVYWRDDEEWKQYAAPHAEAIRRGMADCVNRVGLGTLVSSKYAGGARYAVDLRSLEQINLATGFTRDVKVVNDAPAIGTTSKKLRACQASHKEIRSLEEMVMKLEADLSAVNSKLEDVKSEANRVSAKFSIVNLGVCVLRHLGYWQFCDSAGDSAGNSFSGDDYSSSEELD